MANHQQLVENKNLSNLAGLGVIVGLLAFLYCQHRFGLSYDVAMVLLWGIGAAVALTMMHDRVLSYRYTLSGTTLRLDRFYGRYMRHARDIMFRRIENVGDVDAMKAKYPGARVEKYVRRQCELPQVAVVHIFDNRRIISVIQPDDVIMTALQNRAK